MHKSADHGLTATIICATEKCPLPNSIVYSIIMVNAKRPTHTLIWTQVWINGLVSDS